MKKIITAIAAIVAAVAISSSTKATPFFTGLGDLPGGDFFSATGRGALPGSDLWGAAVGASADGSVIVGNSNSAFGSNTEAFRWTSGGGMVGLGDLPGWGLCGVDELVLKPRK